MRREEAREALCRLTDLQARREKVLKDLVAGGPMAVWREDQRLGVSADVAQCLKISLYDSVLAALHRDEDEWGRLFNLAAAYWPNVDGSASACTCTTGTTCPEHARERESKEERCRTNR